MKAREALQQQEEQEVKQQQEKELKGILMEEHDKTTDEFSPNRMVASGGEVEKELARQMEALAAADRKRRGFPMPAPKEEGNDEGDDDFDYDDAEIPPLVGSSRYQTDFIELGLLGRGGGGEVVKVRNRLDRRLCKRHL
jgi:hypothetical protein